MLKKSYVDRFAPPENEEDDVDAKVDHKDEAEWVKVVKKVAVKNKVVHVGVGGRTSADTSKITKVARKAPADIGAVTPEPKSGLKIAGSGKITIDSGACESVCPLDMLPEEPLHHTSKNGTRYRSAGGQKSCQPR